MNEYFPHEELANFLFIIALLINGIIIFCCVHSKYFLMVTIFYEDQNDKRILKINLNKGTVCRQKDTWLLHMRLPVLPPSRTRMKHVRFHAHHNYIYFDQLLYGHLIRINHNIGSQSYVISFSQFLLGMAICIYFMNRISHEFIYILLLEFHLQI